jgi:hypothetical protein
MNTIPIVNKLDNRNAIIITAVTLLIITLILSFVKFKMQDPLPSDIDPITVEVNVPIKEIVLDNYKLLTNPSGGRKGGAGTDDPISDMFEQTKEFITSEDGKTTVNSGNSKHDNSENSDNPSSTNKNGDDFFLGDDYGGAYDSKGKDDDNLNIQKNRGNGKDVVDGSPRIRKNDPDLSGIKVKETVSISLKLLIDKNGDIVQVDVGSSPLKDEKTLKLIKQTVKNQVKYNKSDYDNLALVWLTVKIESR